MDVSKVTVTGGQTLYARWIGRSVTVDFNSNGGSAPSPSYRNVTVGSAYGALPTVTRAGYSFSGWHTQASGGTNTLVGISTIVAATGDHKLYARWSVETGGVTTISFEPNGGTAPSSLSKQLSPGSAYGDLPTVSRGGYKFDGWYTAATGGNKIESTSRFDGSVKKLYAHWINPNDITVTFNSNGGGAPNPASKTVTVYFDYGTLPAVTRDGYKFEGWYTAASGGTKVEQGTRVTVAGGQTLYARWLGNSVTVKFNVNGGTPSPADKTVKVGDAYGALPAVSRNGYSFNGWNTAASGGTPVGPSTTVTAISTHTLYALWSNPSGVTVTFDSNGGTAPSSLSRQLSPGTAYGDLPTVSRGGYKFDGWYTAASGGNKIESSSRFDGSVTKLYAHWINQNDITVTFNSNGGGAPKPASKTVTVFFDYGALPTVTRDGYKFDGWYTAASGGTKVEGTTKVSIQSAHQLFARWTANSITVSFNANGSGVSNPSGKTVTFDSTYGTLPTVSRDGYTFSGWYTAASGGAKVEGTTKVTNKNAHSLYARWTANSITITFDSNGGNTPNPATKQATVGSAIGTLPTVTRSGYTFDGWFNAQTGGGKLSSSDKISGNYTTFYAHWTANAPAPQPPAPAPPSTITVTFDPAGGSAPKPATKQLTIGSPIGTLPTVTRSGYKFDGWYNAEGGKLKPDGSDKFSGRFTTFYARWTKQ
jgi:uncharacterized repeat protein (TIGR02543 family)